MAGYSLVDEGAKHLSQKTPGRSAPGGTSGGDGLFCVSCAGGITSCRVLPLTQLSYMPLKTYVPGNNSVELLGMSNLTSKGCDVIEECLSRDCLCYAINRTPTADVVASLRPIYSES